jgi:hypothetical protein
MTEDTEADITIWKAIGLIFLYLINYVIHNYNAIMGNIFITLSIAFLLWKWRSEYLKDKKSAENNG